MNLHGYLTVKSSAYRYLIEHADPQHNLLVFLWGSFGDDAKPRWLVSLSRRSSLPLKSLQRGHFGELVNGIPFMIAQPEHAPKLNGCMLVLEGGKLAVRQGGVHRPEWSDSGYRTDEHRILAQ